MIDLTLSFFTDVTRRWAIACGYHPQSARVHLHNRTGSVSCGPLDSGVSAFAMGDDVVGVVEALTKRMLADIGERGDWEPALIASVDAVERSRAQREQEARVPARDER